MDLQLPLTGALERGLRTGEGLADVAEQPAGGRRDELIALRTVHALHLAPVVELGDRVRWQHHPAVAAVKQRLEVTLLARLERYVADDRRAGAPADGSDAVATVRAIGRDGLVPPVYDWVADDAPPEDLVDFLALEGGPDGGFDDQVAICQLGLDGEPKLEMARNYWDEMGRGTGGDVHTELHRRLARALELVLPAPERAPIELLERDALGGVLATNRWLQPEMVGALGLIELQAGPRCRRVLAGLTRIAAPADAFPFYEEHAVADPRHGKDWIDHVVAPLAETPFAVGIVRGARWRSAVNRRFFAAMERRFARPPAELAA